MKKSFSIRLLVIFAGVLLVGILAEPAAAQRRGQGGMRLGEATQAQLLQIDAVQKDLKLTDDEKSKVAAIHEKATSGRRQVMAANSKDSKERGPKLAELNKQLDAEIEKVLDDGQKKRLQEIVLQVNGAGALEKDDIQKALKITDEQKAKLTEIQKANTKARRDAVAQLDGATRTTKETQLFLDGNKKLLEVLTPEQSKQFEEMQGEKIKLDLIPAAAGA